MKWEKSKNKMNVNVKPETEEEIKLVKNIKKLNQSGDLQNFIAQIRSFSKGMEIDTFMARIKDEKSAIRKFRLIGYEQAEQMDDLCAILIVPKDDQQLYEILKEIRPLFPDGKEFDMVNINASSIPCMPPLSYHIVSEMFLEDIGENLKTEIRLQSLNKFLANESIYYPLHKNDDLTVEEKLKLLPIMTPLLLAQANIDSTESLERKKVLEKEIIDTIEDNSELLSKYPNIYYECWSEFSRINFKYKNRDLIEQGEKSGDYFSTNIDDILDATFNHLRTKSQCGNELDYSKVSQIYSKIKNIDYTSLKNIIPDSKPRNRVSGLDRD